MGWQDYEAREDQDREEEEEAGGFSTQASEGPGTDSPEDGNNSEIANRFYVDRDAYQDENFRSWKEDGDDWKKGGYDDYDEIGRFEPLVSFGVRGPAAQTLTKDTDTTEARRTDTTEARNDSINYDYPGPNFYTVGTALESGNFTPEIFSSDFGYGDFTSWGYEDTRNMQGGGYNTEDNERSTAFRDVWKPQLERNRAINSVTNPSKGKKIGKDGAGNQLYMSTVSSGAGVNRTETSYVYTLDSKTGTQIDAAQQLYRVEDENKLGDGLANVLGFGLSFAFGSPISPRVDTKDMTGLPGGFAAGKDYVTGVVPDTSAFYTQDKLVAGFAGFGKTVREDTRIETAAERVSRLAREDAEQAQSAEGNASDDMRILPATTATTTTGTTGSEPTSYEDYFATFTQGAPTYTSPYDVLRSRAAQGGEMTRGAEPDYLDNNAEYVRQMPDVFMRDPATARTPEEVSAIFAHNRKVKQLALPQKMALGGDPQPAPPQAPAGDPQMPANGSPVGHVGAPAEQVSPQEMVADDIPVDVEEGTFVINGPAAKIAGRQDIEEMLEKAIAYAEKRGIRIDMKGSPVPKDKLVPLLVSKSEILIPKVLADIIGRGRLEKINKRGEKEVQRIQQEQEQRQGKALGGPSVSAEGGLEISRGNREGKSRANISAEYEGDGFAVRPRASINENTSSNEYPDGVVVDSKNRNIGFAIDGELLLKKDTALRLGFEKHRGKTNSTAALPRGEKIQFGNNSTMTRFNMGATFGDLGIDLSQSQSSGGPDLTSGKATYKINENGSVYLEGNDQGSGRIGLEYRF
tara:strand:+ start:1594 stop:3999 length:2406 start_codon:yes stop_codon:yes gene_type:complete